MFRELIRILRIDVVHSYSLAADRLVLAAGSGQLIPWLVHPKSHTSDLAGLAVPSRRRSLSADPETRQEASSSKKMTNSGSQDETITAAMAEKPRWVLTKNFKHRSDRSNLQRSLCRNEQT